MPGFNVTFETITPESAEHGDVESQGFEMEGATLRDCLSFLRRHGGHVEANECPCVSPRWFTFYGEPDMRGGIVTNYGLHVPENATPSSRRRIARLIGAYGAL